MNKAPPLCLDERLVVSTKSNNLSSIFNLFTYMPKTKKSSTAISPSTTAPDGLEPFPASGTAVLHEALTLIEVADPHDLTAILSDGRLRGYVLARLSECEAVVLPQHTRALVEAMRKAGYTPKQRGGSGV